MRIKVLLVDDHELVRTGIRRLLEDFDDIEIMAEAENGEEAISLVRQNKPDVILMDVNMPGIGGLEATRKLLQIHQDMKVIIVTIHVEEPFPSRLLKAGATGYLTKGCAITEIVDAIRAVHKGKRFIGGDVAQQLAMTMLPGNDKSPFDALSQRELQVMLMVTQGQKIQEIAEMLCLSPKTVSTYRYRLFEKLDVKSDVELTHLAMRHGMITDSGSVDA